MRVASRAEGGHDGVEGVEGGVFSWMRVKGTYVNMWFCEASTSVIGQE